MRINIYNEELTADWVFVKREVEETGKTYYGFRVFLKSAPELHHTPEDDDRSAVTFWWGTKYEAWKWLDTVYREVSAVLDHEPQD